MAIKSNRTIYCCKLNRVETEMKWPREICKKSGQLESKLWTNSFAISKIFVREKLSNVSRVLRWIYVKRLGGLSGIIDGLSVSGNIFYGEFRFYPNLECRNFYRKHDCFKANFLRNFSKSASDAFNVNFNNETLDIFVRFLQYS